MNPKTNQITTLPEEKAEIFANQYEHQPAEVPDNEFFENYIIRSIATTEPSGLNSTITAKELEFGIKNLKSKATGQDLIHNKMQKNLTDINKKHVLYLFNVLLKTSYVPEN